MGIQSTPAKILEITAKKMYHPYDFSELTMVSRSPLGGEKVATPANIKFTIEKAIIA